MGKISIENSSIDELISNNASTKTTASSIKQDEVAVRGDNYDINYGYQKRAFQKIKSNGNYINICKKGYRPGTEAVLTLYSGVSTCEKRGDEIIITEPDGAKHIISSPDNPRRVLYFTLIGGGGSGAKGSYELLSSINGGGGGGGGTLHGYIELDKLAENVSIKIKVGAGGVHTGGVGFQGGDGDDSFIQYTVASQYISYLKAHGGKGGGYGETFKYYGGPGGTTYTENLNGFTVLERITGGRGGDGRHHGNEATDGASSTGLFFTERQESGVTKTGTPGEATTTTECGGGGGCTPIGLGGAGTIWSGNNQLSPTCGGGSGGVGWSAIESNIETPLPGANGIFILYY